MIDPLVLGAYVPFDGAREVFRSEVCNRTYPDEHRHSEERRDLRWRLATIWPIGETHSGVLSLSKRAMVLETAIVPLLG